MRIMAFRLNSTSETFGSGLVLDLLGKDTGNVCASVADTLVLLVEKVCYSLFASQHYQSTEDCKTSRCFTFLQDVLHSWLPYLHRTSMFRL